MCRTDMHYNTIKCRMHKLYQFYLYLSADNFRDWGVGGRKAEIEGERCGNWEKVTVEERETCTHVKRKKRDKGSKRWKDRKGENKRSIENCETEMEERQSQKSQLWGLIFNPFLQLAKLFFFFFMSSAKCGLCDKFSHFGPSLSLSTLGQLVCVILKRLTDCLVPHAGFWGPKAPPLLHSSSEHVRHSPSFFLHSLGTVYTEILHRRQRQGAPLSEAPLKHPHNCWSGHRTDSSISSWRIQVSTCWLKNLSQQWLGHVTEEGDSGKTMISQGKSCWELCKKKKTCQGTPSMVWRTGNAHPFLPLRSRR